jgi:hypothetical protein
VGSQIPIRIVTDTDTAFGGLVKVGDFPAEDLVLYAEGVNYYPLPMTQADFDAATGGSTTTTGFLLEDGSSFLLLESGDILLLEA